MRKLERYGTAPPRQRCKPRQTRVAALKGGPPVKRADRVKRRETRPPRRHTLLLKRATPARRCVCERRKVIGHIRTDDFAQLLFAEHAPES